MRIYFKGREALKSPFQETFWHETTRVHCSPSNCKADPSGCSVLNAFWFVHDFIKAQAKRVGSVDSVITGMNPTANQTGKQMSP